MFEYTKGTELLLLKVTDISMSVPREAWINVLAITLAVECLTLGSGGTWTKNGKVDLHFGNQSIKVSKDEFTRILKRISELTS